MPKGRQMKLKLETLADWRKEHGLPKPKKSTEQSSNKKYERTERDSRN